MYKASREIAEKMSLTDIVVEVRDARIPFTSAAFAQVASSRARVIVLNKSDLSEPMLLRKAISQLADSLQSESSPHSFVLPFSCRQVKRAQIASVLNTLAGIPVRKRLKSLPTKVFVVGVPNVGKSSFINLLQRHCRWKDVPLEHTIDDRGVAKVGKHPGVTRNVTGFVVSHQPYIYMLDSPGVMYPRIDNYENGMRLIIAGCIRDHSMESIAACEFLLNKWIERNDSVALSRLGIDIKDWNISAQQVIRKVAHRICAFQKENKEQTNGNEDLLRTSIYILNKFRQGSLGRLFLDPLT